MIARKEIGSADLPREGLCVSCPMELLVRRSGRPRSALAASGGLILDVHRCAWPAPGPRVVQLRTPGGGTTSHGKRAK